MKLCYWTVFPNTYQTALLEALRSEGVDVVACYFRTYDAVRAAMGWKTRPLQDWEFQVTGPREARRRIPDYDERVQSVGAFFNLTYWRILLRCIAKGLPWCVVTEGTRGRWFMRPLFALFARLADRYARHVFCIGQRAVDQFRAAGVRESKLSWFSYVTPSPPVSLPPRDQNLTFVFAGSLTERKAVAVMGAAFRRVHATFPDVRFLVVGDGPLRSTIEDCTGVELAGSVSQEDVYRWIARGHVMMLVSRYDPWGVSLMEGAACAQAMIGSDQTGSARDMIEDGVNGFLVPAGDVEALAEAMTRYARNPGLAVSHGLAARRSAERTSGPVAARRMITSLAQSITTTNNAKETNETTS